MKSRRTRLARVLFALAFALAFGASARAQQRPLLTEDVDVLPPGTARVEAGIDFMQDAKFPASGLTGDLTRVGGIGVHIGLSPNVEFSVEGVAQNFLGINTRVRDELQAHVDLYQTHFETLRADADRTADAIADSHAIAEAIEASDQARTRAVVEEIVQRIADWGREGWTLNESIHMVTAFLGAR